MEHLFIVIYRCEGGKWKPEPYGVCEDRRMAEKMIEVAKHKGRNFRVRHRRRANRLSGNNGRGRELGSERSNQFPGPQNKAGSQAQLAAVYDGALPVSLGGAGNSTR